MMAQSMVRLPAVCAAQSDPWPPCHPWSPFFSALSPGLSHGLRAASNRRPETCPPFPHRWFAGKARAKSLRVGETAPSSARRPLSVQTHHPRRHDGRQEPSEVSDQPSAISFQLSAATHRQLTKGQLTPQLTTDDKQQTTNNKQRTNSPCPPTALSHGTAPAFSLRATAPAFIDIRRVRRAAAPRAPVPVQYENDETKPREKPARIIPSRADTGTCRSRCPAIGDAAGAPRTRPSTR